MLCIYHWHSSTLSPTNISLYSFKDVNERTLLKIKIALLKSTKFGYKIHLICQSSNSIKKKLFFCEPMLAPNDHCFFSQMLLKHLFNNFKNFTKSFHVMPRGLDFILCIRGECLYFYIFVCLMLSLK